MSRKINNDLIIKLREFIKKYYINLMIKGGVLTILNLLLFFIVFSILEHFSNFDVGFRTFLFWFYILINSIISIIYFITPLLKLFRIGKTLTYKQAAHIIGKHFREIDDKLLNILELSEMNSDSNELIGASIENKIKNIKTISFSTAIKFSENLRIAKWLIAPVLLILVFMISGNSDILSESSSRIIKHNTFFEPKAPFDYVILNPLEVEQYDDLEIKIEITGNVIPEKAYILIGNNKYALKKSKDNTHSFLIKNIKEEKAFRLSAGGYTSREYKIKIKLKPSITDIKTTIIYPNYTKLERKLVNNLGDLLIPKGSKVIWEFKLKNTRNIQLQTNNKIKKFDVEDKFNYESTYIKDTEIKITSHNKYLTSDTIIFQIKILNDKNPKIKVERIYDSLLTTYFFKGSIDDDYGLERLEFTSNINIGNSTTEKKTKILIDKNKDETFFFKYEIQELIGIENLIIESYFKVWDNDKINGSKSTKSKTFVHKSKTQEELKKELDNLNTQIKSGINSSINQSIDIKKDIKEIEKKLIDKKVLDWEEKQKIKELITKQQKLKENINKTKENNRLKLNKSQNKDSKLLEKQKQLQELMDKVLDDESKKLIEELEKLISEDKKEKIKDLLEKLDQQNDNLEKELDRELELFKQLEFEQKTEEIIDEISKLERFQKDIKDKTDSIKSKKDDLLKKQQKAKEDFAKIKESIKDLKKKNDQLENKNEIPETKDIEEEIEDQIKESQENLEKNKKNKSSQSQKNALEKLDQLKQKMQKMQEGNSSETVIENAETLREILENLIKLSFNQEKLLEKTALINKENPDFIQLVKSQKKLSDDSKIIEDSLLALSKRAPQIESKINEEINIIKSNLNKATKSLEERFINKSTEKQQFIMTSTNNLALLLSEILKQMNQELSDMPSKCNKPKNCNNPKNSNKPSMNELKNAQKKLNDQLKESMKKGKPKKGDGNKGDDSKKLMEMSKKQEMIRLQLESIEKENGLDGDPKINNELKEEMKNNEYDIINNQITKETLNRLDKIITKFLEYENAEKEQEEDMKRESNEWNYNLINNSNELKKYQENKKTQRELLKTSPINLTPFYKQEVDKYFKNILRISND